ncbi:septin-7 isoform X1 [Ixodes scapularis]
MPSLPRRSASSGAADVPAARLNYRYAGLERFSGRPRVYENPPADAPPPLPERQAPLTPPSSQLSFKREMFFRESPVASSTVGVPTTVAAATLGAGLASPSAPKEEGTSPYATSGRSQAEGCVGFASLPNQVYRKAVKKGFEFTLMVVGESGLGKSTLLNSMFLTDVYSNEYPGPSQRVKKTVQVETTRVVLRESSVHLCLTVVDTPGFGDAVDNSQCWQPVADYVEAQFAAYLDAESRVHRSALSDGRVHCCLYFIAPSGHGLKPLDIEFMKRLHDKVNIIPVVAKADTMTPEECSLFKRTILNEVTQHKIRLYEFPDCEDEEENKRQKPLRERVPFAVVGSNTVVEVNGKRVRGRKYPWGVAEVENMEHCDYLALRNMLIRTHMQDLKDITNNVHYENYRCRNLGGMGGAAESGRSNKNPLAQIEEEKKEHEAKMRRMEKEMEQVFEMKVREKVHKLRESESDLQRRHEQMKKSLEQQKLELEEKRRNFEKEKAAFDLSYRDMDDVFRKLAVDSNNRE